MRMFQATGVGSCLLTDTASNMQDLYEPDVELVTFSCVAECVEKANYLMANPAKAREIANKGQQRTLRDHSSQARYNTFHQIMLEALKN